MALTPKQTAFVAEYIVDFNATQAAVRAGYSPRSAKQVAHDMLSRPEISEAVAAAVQARIARTGITADRAVEEIARLALSDITHAVRWGEAVAIEREDGDPIIAQGLAMVASEELSPAIRAAIAEVRQTKDGLAIKLHSKTAALDMLAKHLGIYKPDRHEHTGKDGGPIETRELSMDERLRKIAALVARQEAETT